MALAEPDDGTCAGGSGFRLATTGAKDRWYLSLALGSLGSRSRWYAKAEVQGTARAREA